MIALVACIFAFAYKTTSFITSLDIADIKVCIKEKSICWGSW